MDFTRLGPEKDARCLVIGGCGGIGYAYVQGLLAAGCRVAVVDMARSIAERGFDGAVELIAADVTDEAATAAAIDGLGQRWGGLDVYAYISGINVTPGPVDKLSTADWHTVLDVNLTGAFLTCRAALPWLRQSSAAAMLFVASGLHANVEQGYGAYAASKGGLVSLMKVIAKENAPRIRANAVAPGVVETAFLSGGTGRGGREGDRGWFAGLGAHAERVLASIPLGRIAVADDVAGPMLFLSGEASRYMTGQVVFVNGGRYAQ